MPGVRLLNVLLNATFKRVTIEGLTTCNIFAELLNFLVKKKKAINTLLQTHVKVERFQDSRALRFHKSRFTSDLKLIVLLYINFQLCYVSVSACFLNEK